MNKYIVTYTSHEEVIEAESHEEAIAAVEFELRESFGIDLTDRLTYEAREM